ncbi:MAG: hypothetical protein QXL67_04805 [Candidatus Bathyarchaeia archaeon]
MDLLRDDSRHALNKIGLSLRCLLTEEHSRLAKQLGVDEIVGGAPTIEPGMSYHGTGCFGSIYHYSDKRAIEDAVLGPRSSTLFHR